MDTAAHEKAQAQRQLYAIRRVLAPLQPLIHYLLEFVFIFLQEYLSILQPDAFGKRLTLLGGI
jgi:hypothetical protein